MHGFKTQIPMRSKSIGCPKLLPCLLKFVLVIASDMHLEPENGKRAETVDFHTAKHVQIQATAFRYFQTISSNMTSDLFTVV